MAEESVASTTATTFEPTIRGARIACKQLTKVLTKNRNSRNTHPNNPEKFINDEVALHDALLSMKDAAAYINLYPELVTGGMVDSLLLLLHHENVDIATCVLDVLVELVDPSILTITAIDDSVDGREDDNDRRAAQNVALVANSFVDGNGLDLLSSNLGRLDENVEEDAKGVEDALTLIEYLLELDRLAVLGRSSLTGGYTNKEEEGGSRHQSSVVACICEKTSLLSWLFERISKEEEDDDDDKVRTVQNTTTTTTTTPAVIRLHCAEVLSVILQHEDYTTSLYGDGTRLAALLKYKSAFDDDEDRINNKKAKKSTDDETSNTAVTIDGMEILLIAIAKYRKTDPQIEVQCEFLENVFGILSASLLREDNVTDFVNAEGIELMLRCIRQKVHAGGGALRVLNFALSRSSSSSSSRNGTNEDCDDDAYKVACETFVTAGGLKLLFPLYMARKSVIPCPATCSDGGSALAKKKKGVQVSKRARRATNARKQWLVDVERNVINIMYSLTRQINVTSRYDAYSRLLVKFVEEDCEKCDRTIELCLKYDERARIAEYQYYRSDEADEAERLGIDVETAALGAKLRGGVDLFHCSCAILSFACVGSKRCRGHIMEQLKLQGACISGEWCYLLTAFSFFLCKVDDAFFSCTYLTSYRCSYQDWSQRIRYTAQ
jgi:beta-catenin-like protein 1